MELAEVDEWENIGGGESWLEQFIDPTVQLYQVPDFIHMNEPRQIHTCDICETSFTEKRSLDRHKRERHENDKTFTCLNCFKVFRRERTLKKHGQICNGAGSSMQVDPTLELTPPTKKPKLEGQELIDYEVCTPFPRFHSRVVCFRKQ